MDILDFLCGKLIFCQLIKVLVSPDLKQIGGSPPPALALGLAGLIPFASGNETGVVDIIFPFPSYWQRTM